MRHRLRGLRHMIQTKDKILIKCHSSNVTWDDYVKDCNLAVNTVNINSDEYSTEEEELARKERSNKKRLKNIYSMNSVIKICDKPWQSTRVVSPECNEGLFWSTQVNKSVSLSARLTVESMP